MKFVCDRCQTKYSIADEKVRGKILKVRCKSCTNIITVREEGAGAGAGAGAAAPRRPSAPAVPIGSPGSHPSRPPTPSVPRAPLAPPVERRAAPRPEPPADDGVAWYMALDGNRTGPFTRRQLIDKVAPLPRDADLHVWSEKLGSWKPPTDVPALAHELAARRRPPTPVSASPAVPPPPPPFPGAPRRPTASSMPIAAAAAPAPARQTGAHAVVGSPIAPGVGLKLPPPVAPPGGRRPTGPVARPAGLAASALAPAGEPGLDIDPSSMLETPAPQPHMLHGLGTNGVSHGESGANGAPGAADRSDVLNTLNLASASGARPAPRLLSSEAVVGWQPTAAEQPGARQKTTRIVLALLGVVAAICVVLMLNVTKKQKPVVAPPPKAIADPLAGVVDNPPPNPPAAPTPPAPPTAAAAAPEAPEPASPHGRGKGHPAPRGRTGVGPIGTQPPPVGTSPQPAPAVADNSAANARYRDSGRALNITGGGGVSRPAPSQADIMKVIANNRGGIKNCYQRALLRDNSLTHGKISVKVTIGISGRVKHTAIDGPVQFRALEPCIKEIVGRWAFPPAGDEYGTEFVYVFQGNE